MTSELSTRALEAAVAVAKAHGLACDDPIVLADRSNVIVHLSPTPVVARVATTTALVRPEAGAWLEREIAVAGFLAERGVAVVPPSDELPPGPHQHNDLAVSFWKHIECDPDQVPSNEEIGRSLAELHTVLREYPNELPYLDPFFGEVQKALDYLESSGALELQSASPACSCPGSTSRAKPPMIKSVVCEVEEKAPTACFLEPIWNQFLENR